MQIVSIVIRILVLAGFLVPTIIVAQELKPSLAEAPINGEWNVRYTDDDLGVVSGVAMVDEAAGRADVVYTHPMTGEEFRLSATSIVRSGVTVTIKLEGKSPVLYRDDGLNYPQRHLIVPEKTGKIIASVGSNQAKIALAPRAPSDQEKVTLKFTLANATTLQGTWQYRADPFTRRARDGYGRTGEFKRQAEGDALQTGAETWTRPSPEIMGAFVLDQQLGWNKDLNDPFFPYLSKDDEFEGVEGKRLVVIFGVDLPDGRNTKADIKSQSDGVTYGRVIYPDSTFKFLQGRPISFEEAQTKLGKIFESVLKKDGAVTVAKALDLIVVEATLAKDIVPGFQKFSLDGSEGTWTLMFGNNGADIRFVRAIDPTVIPIREVDTFDVVLKNPDQSISRVRVNIEITDKDRKSSVAPVKRTLVKPGQLVRGDIANADTFISLLPDTIERFRRWGLFPRAGENNTTNKPIVANPGVLGGRYGTLTLKKDGSFTYKAFPKRWKNESLEKTTDAFINETLLVAVRTEVTLPRDRIFLTLGVNGAVQKIRGEELVPAYRVSDDPQLYLTDPILLTGSRTGGNENRRKEPNATTLSTGQKQRQDISVVSRFLRPSHPLTVVQGDKVSAVIADPGLISLLPEPAKITASISPARLSGGPSYLWKDHLLRAAACYPDLGEINWDRSDNDFVAVVEEELNFSWWKILSPVTFLFSSETLQTNFQLGDHAAMLLMRQAFIQQLRRKIKEYKFTANSKEDLQAFWTTLSPYRWIVRQHALTNLKFEIEVSGPDGRLVPFRDTYWNESKQLPRTYDRVDDIPEWILRATRQALQKYIEILSETLETAKEVEECEIKDLVKLTGRNFQSVETWLIPRMMRHEGDNRLRWLPDYQARLRIKIVADKFWQVQAYQKLSEEDTQSILMVGAILTLPVSAAGAPAVILLAALNLGTQAIVEGQKYLESREEIAFSRGTVDILGFGRFEQSKANEFSGYDLAIGLLVSIAGEVAGDELIKFAAKNASRGARIAAWVARKGVRSSVSSIAEAASRFRYGVRYLAAKRGRALLEKAGFDFNKLSRQLRARDYRGIAEYIGEAIRQRAKRAWIGESNFKALERLAARDKSWKNFVDSSSPDVKQVLKDSPARPKFKKFMLATRNVVDDALRAGGRRREEALALLRFTPQTTPERFSRALEARMKIKREPLGFDAYDMASPRNRAIVDLLENGDWRIQISEKSANLHYIKIRSPGNFEDELLRGFDPKTGELTFVKGYRDAIPGFIDVGLPFNLSEKGFPAFLFAQLVYMNARGIAYAGKEGHLLKSVRMSWILNARTNVQLAWFKATRYPTKTYEQLQREGLLDQFILNTRSLDYARSLINMAGYKVKAARFEFFGEPGSLGTLGRKYKVSSDGESWVDYLKRHGFTEESKGPPGLGIVIEVEPHRGAFTKTAANDGNLPSAGAAGGADKPPSEPPNNPPAGPELPGASSEDLSGTAKLNLEIPSEGTVKLNLEIPPKVNAGADIDPQNPPFDPFKTVTPPSGGPVSKPPSVEPEIETVITSSLKPTIIDDLVSLSNKAWADLRKVPGASDRISKIEWIKETYNNASAEGRAFVFRVAEEMRALGISSLDALSYAALHYRRVDPLAISPNMLRGHLVAEIIVWQGTRTVTLKEFMAVTGLPQSAARAAADSAAKLWRYAPLPGEIRPGRLYPPVGF